VIVSTRRAIPQLPEGPRTRETHEKKLTYGEQIEHPPIPLSSQIHEKIDVIDASIRSRNTPRADTQNEGITQDVDENKGSASIRIGITRYVQENKRLIATNPTCY
jgi:hypothetical protein